MTVNANTWYQNGPTEYYVSIAKQNFDDAKASCEDHQAVLVMIQTKDVQLFLDALVTSEAFPSG